MIQERTGREAGTIVGWTAEDWLRWAVTDPRPGDLLLELHRTGEIGLYPELAAMVDVPQDPEWHPEGPVHTHVAHVLNAAAEIADRVPLEPQERAVLIFAALTHDLGKATTTVLRKKRDGRMRWTSYGHDHAGVPLTKRLLGQLGMPEELVRKAAPLVEAHMEYRAFSDPHADQRTVRRLAWRIAPATLRQLGYLIEADHSGRPPLPKQLPASAVRMLSLAEGIGVLDGAGPRQSSHTEQSG